MISRAFAKCAIRTYRPTGNGSLTLFLPSTLRKISYPFLHADRIKTPTLFLGGERDFNVPVQGGQQMYQALRSLGIDTQMVIYPNENHGITWPSYVRDRYERYLSWYDKYLKKPPEAAGRAVARW